MRTHLCGQLGPDHAGDEVTLAGWVHARRDHGGVIFFDLRDREGLVQVVLHPQEQAGAYPVAERLRSEFVVAVTGVVRLRPGGTENPSLATGSIEVAASSIEVLAESQALPFQIDDRSGVGEEVRLRYRYLDLRRPEMQQIMALRHKVIAAMRRYLDASGFWEVETPMLTKSTPEGARDFLVPSRLAPGTFFALPQSPQLFKQLLMISGVDRYYQVVRCFRDEDPRADRQPEFTQLDMELSFAGEHKVREVVEGLLKEAFSAAGIALETPFPEIPYDDAMERFGTDRPDLRYDLELIEATEIFATTGVEVFHRILDQGGAVKAIKVPGGAALPRKDLDQLIRTAKDLGAGGLVWIAFEEEGISSPLAKALSEAEVAGIVSATGAAAGDLVLIVCDRREVARRVLGVLRTDLAARLGLAGEGWRFVWVVEPPLVEWNAAEGRWDPVHHPFTSPSAADEDLLDERPGSVRARAYDIVLNGWELGGGSVRIHRPELQRKIFRLIGIDEAHAERRFGWFIRAFDYGAPPHAGLAIGIDRLVSMVAGKDSIRDAIAFPKTSSFTDLLTGAPDEVDESQMAELHLRLREVPPAKT